MFAAAHRTAVLVILLTVVAATVWPARSQVVTEDWTNSIEAHLRQVDEATSAEIVVVVLDSLWGHGITKDGSEIHEIVQLGVHIFNDMPLDTPNGPVVGIGKKGKDNGVLVLVAIQDQEWRIEVGYGLEGDITDLESSHIAQQHLIPPFQEERYGEGLFATVVALAQKIPAPAEPSSLPVRGRYFYETVSSGEPPTWLIPLIILVFAGVLVVVVVLAVLAKKGKIKTERVRTTGERYGRAGGGRPSGRGGSKGGGGRSGGGGSKGKW